MAVTGRQYREAETRRRRLWTRRIIFAFFVFIGLVVLLESPLTRIRHIAVSGNSGVNTAAVVAVSGLHPGMSLFQVNKGAVVSRIVKQEPLVQSVSVKIDFSSGTVSLGIRQKSVVAVLEAGNSFYQLLDDGTVYRKVALDSALGVPLVEVSHSTDVRVGEVTTIPGLKSLCTQVSNLPTPDLQGISQISLDTYGDATVFFENGFAAQLSSSTFSQTLSEIPDVIAYFIKQGYGPGLIDMTGKPPYRYTPFQARRAKAGQQ